jgi:diguanylate cyclase (GGDEF)-like protein
MRRWETSGSRGQPSDESRRGRWLARACVGGLLAVLCFLAGFSLLTESGLAGEAARAQTATRLSKLYGDARFWVGQLESLERKYRLEPGPAVLKLHTQAGRNLLGDLHAVAAIDHSAVTRRLMATLQPEQAAYASASASMFRAVDSHDTPLAIHYDHKVVDPVFGAIVTAVYARSDAAARQALHESNRSHQRTVSARAAIAVAFAVGLALLGGFALILLRLRRRVSVAHRTELERLASAALVDSLTGLRNHRAFHEDLSRELRRQERGEGALALIMLDLDGLKAVNDMGGHQAGDERLKALANALSTGGPGSAYAYRVGGDEFAVILPGARAWDAVEAAHRVQVTLAAEKIGVTAGIAEAIGPAGIDTVIHEADVALIAGKRHHQDVTIYSPELAPTVAASDGARDAEHVHSLSSALARAVDAKDAYTRSHCQTVSQLCALIAIELGFEPEHITAMRLAGLLHDVGKIGIPDAILNKPAALTEAEYEQMKRHAILGEEIVAAADRPTEAHWIRHHHERYDGDGYPDGLAGEAIPLQSRIILVADAYEAMTSDRPYRQAPGRDFAIAELRRHAASQFDPAIVAALCHALDPAAGAGHDNVPEPSPGSVVAGAVLVSA